MKAAIAKTEERRLNKFVWANVGQPENCDKPATETKNPLSSPDRHYNNRKTRTDGLIGTQNSRNMQEKAFYLGNVGSIAVSTE